MPKLELVNARKQWRFSIWMLPQSILGFFRTQLDTLLTATYFGKAQLGSYHTMKYIAFIPTSHILIPLTQPLLVELRKASSTKKEFSKIFNASFFMALLIAVPISSFVYFFHELTTEVLLGDNWLEYSELLGIFCIFVSSTVISLQCSKVLIVFDKPNHLLLYEVISFLVIYSILILSGFSNIVEFAKTRVITEVFVISILLIYVSIKYSDFKHFLKLSIALLSICLCAINAVLFVKAIELELLISNVFLKLSVSVISVFLLYVLQLIVLYLLVFRFFEECIYLKSLAMRALAPIRNRLGNF
jgi:O-antigen/teichoic acid export membrane protein